MCEADRCGSRSHAAKPVTQPHMTLAATRKLARRSRAGERPGPRMEVRVMTRADQDAVTHFRRLGRRKVVVAGVVCYPAPGGRGQREPPPAASPLAATTVASS